MKKILIAEDDKYLASAYEMKLTKYGYSVRVAVDGVKFLEECNKEVPDLIILDLVMPNMDGFKVLEELKKNARFKSIPVIVATNVDEQKDRDKCDAYGVVSYMVKSTLSFDKLSDKIRFILHE